MAGGGNRDPGLLRWHDHCPPPLPCQMELPLPLSQEGCKGCAPAFVRGFEHAEDFRDASF